MSNAYEVLEKSALMKHQSWDSSDTNGWALLKAGVFVHV